MVYCRNKLHSRTFSIFAIGDHIFGDRLELLEHTLFWFITLFSWVAFVHSDKFLNVHNYVLPKKQMTASLLSITVIAMVTHFSIIKHKNEAFQIIIIFLSKYMSKLFVFPMFFKVILFGYIQELVDTVDENNRASSNKANVPCTLSR